MSNEITFDLDVEQFGQIKVHTQILNDLSSGIYSSPATCIKELVNNSYDAEAKNVIIRVKPLQDNITIIDDGNGMNAKDFDNDFAWISKSNKREKGDFSPNLNRPLIGKIGIGFIAVNEICDELEISSSKKGEKFKFTANVNFKEYFEQAESEKIETDSGEKGIIKALYTLVNEEEEENEHYTVIRLLGLKDGVRKILEDKTYTAQKLKKEKRYYDKSLFKSMKDLLQHHFDKNLRSFSDDNEYVRFILDLSSFIPVEYVDNGPIEGVSDSIIDSLIKEVKDLDFKVDLDGIYLKKPIFFPKRKNVSTDFISFEESVKVNSEEKEDEITFKGYFYVQNKILYPRELNGVALRIRGIPIAAEFGFDSLLMRYPNYMNQIFRNWISGEIYIERGLESAMNIDRSSFRITHPDYLVLQEKLHRILDDLVFPATLNLYETGKNKREKAKEKKKSEARKSILDTKKINLSITTKKDNASEEKLIAPIKITSNKKKSSTIEVNQAISKKFKKSDWDYLEEIFVIFEYAFQESKGDTAKLRETFYKKIADWKNIS